MIGFNHPIRRSVRLRWILFFRNRNRQPSLRQQLRRASRKQHPKPIPIQRVRYGILLFTEIVLSFVYSDQPKPVANADPWGASTNNNNGHDWAQFQSKDASSPFGNTEEWPQQTAVSNENSSNGAWMISSNEKFDVLVFVGAVQYRVLYDYTPERPDELTISAGDIITVCSSITVHM
jgi:hypothetical protein